jgi:hypothetical protein
MTKLSEWRNRDQWSILEELWKRIKSVENRSPFYGTGMKPDGRGGVVSNDFDGNLDDLNAGTKGWALNSARAAFGELLLRPGSIGNDSLTSPVDGKVGNVGASGFSLTAGSFAELAGQNITVPAGFTQALVTAGASVFSYNPNTTGGSNGAGGDAIYCYAACGVQTSHANPVGVSGNGGYANSFSSAGFEFTGLTTGQVLRLSVYGCSAYQNIASHPDNYANAYASVIWLR